MKPMHLAKRVLPFVVAAATIATAYAAPPSARPIITPPIYVESAGVASLQVLCSIVNVQDEARTVKTELVQNDGVAMHSSDVTVAPGRVSGLMASVPPGFFVRSVYCRFQVLDGANTDIRATIQVGEPVQMLLPAQ